MVRALDTWVASENLPDHRDGDDAVMSYTLCTPSVQWTDHRTGEMPQKMRELHNLVQAGILTSDEARVVLEGTDSHALEIRTQIQALQNLPQGGPAVQAKIMELKDEYLVLAGTKFK
jgi:hypothetical protein